MKALDLSWHQAVAARDVEAYSRLFADDYGLDLDGLRRLTKEQEIEAIRVMLQRFVRAAKLLR